MVNTLKLPVGIDSFEKIRKNGFYYVDKTKLIEQLVETGGEVLPGMMPKVIGNICKDLPVPVIAGGMIREKEDVMALLKAGVTSVSSTNPEIWFE